MIWLQLSEQGWQRQNSLRNIVIEDVRGTADSRVASSITGIPGLRPRNIVLRNVHLTVPGGGTEADANGKRPFDVEAYEWLDKAGFDQIPTGSNFSCDTNFADTVKFCDAHCSQDRLKGYMMAPWTLTFAIHEEKSMQAISQMAEAIKARKLV